MEPLQIPAIPSFTDIGEVDHYVDFADVGNDPLAGLGDEESTNQQLAQEVAVLREQVKGLQTEIDEFSTIPDLINKAKDETYQVRKKIKLEKELQRELEEEYLRMNQEEKFRRGEPPLLPYLQEQSQGSRKRLREEELEANSAAATIRRKYFELDYDRKYEAFLDEYNKTKMRVSNLLDSKR